MDFERSAGRCDLDDTIRQAGALRYGCNSARSSATCQCLANASLPHPHFEFLTINDANKLHVRSSWKKRMMFEHRTDLVNVERGKFTNFRILVEKDHKVRIPHTDC